MVSDGVEIHRLFQPHIFGVEANQFQELLGPEFETEFRHQDGLGNRLSVVAAFAHNPRPIAHRS